jgi:drug/metabolite transporter (DMT)-like permease
MNARISASGLAFALVTSIGWGLNWPIMKYVLAQWPPLSARGWTGVAGALALALYAVAMGISLKVPRDQWLRLCVSAFLNVSLWMAVMGIALVYLPASEATVIAYTMPVWTALLAWPLLGERMTLTRVIALIMAFAGLAALLGGNEMSASLAKLPGVVLALGGAIGFALGTIFLKKWPIQLSGATSAAWQIGIGCVPVALAGLVFEAPALSALDTGGWAALAYMTFVQFCIAYVCWFAALERLPASVAAIATMLVPVIGVTVSAIALHEPLGPAKIAALVLTVGGVALAARS